MSGGKRDELTFLETLSHDLASEVFEDEVSCEEALRLGSDADAAIARARGVADRAVAEQRRARIAALGHDPVLGRGVPATRMPGRYGAVSRTELMRMIGERQAAVEFRDLTNVPDDDLRSLLEDLDAVKTDEGSGGK